MWVAQEKSSSVQCENKWFKIFISIFFSLLIQLCPLESYFNKRGLWAWLEWQHSCLPWAKSWVQTHQNKTKNPKEKKKKRNCFILKSLIIAATSWENDFSSLSWFLALAGVITMKVISFCCTGTWIQPFFCDGFFWDRVSQTICLGWFQSEILLISDSWVARITGMSHWCPAGPKRFSCCKIYIFFIPIPLWSHQNLPVRSLVSFSIIFFINSLS
jgi:hypothetical protein